MLRTFRTERTASTADLHAGQRYGDKMTGGTLEVTGVHPPNVFWRYLDHRRTAYTSTVSQFLRWIGDGRLTMQGEAVSERTAIAPTTPRRKVPSHQEHGRLGRLIADLVAKKSRPKEIAVLAKAAFPKAAWDFGRVAGEAEEAFQRITGAEYAGSDFEPQHLIDAIDAAEDALRLKTMYERWVAKEVRVEFWDERDRIHIGIQDEEDPRGEYIVSWWDDEARQMFDDGFFKHGPGREFEQSVIEYADEHGIFPYATGRGESIQERVAAPRKPKAEPVAEPVAGAGADAKAAMDSALSHLSMAERQMERFISRADDPMGPMDEVAQAAGEIVARSRRGEPIPARDIGQVGIALSALERTFGPVYGPFAEARGLVYRAAEALGISTRRTGAKKESPPPLEGKKPRDLASEVEGIGKDFHKAFRDVQEKSAKALNAARRAQDAQTEDSVKAAIESFLDFRDAVGPGYYSMLNGVVRRTDEMMSRMGRSRVREIPGEPLEAPPEASPSASPPKAAEAPAAEPAAPPKRGGVRKLFGL